MRANRIRDQLPLLLGLSLLAALALMALLPGLLAPHSPTEMFAPWRLPEQSHPLGTNDMGYDILSELIYAAAPTLTVGFGAALLSLGVGVTMGLAAGLGRGFWARLADVAIQMGLLVPLLPAAIVVAAVAGSGTGTLVLTIGLLGWGGTARAVRAGATALRQADFFTALQLLGLSRWRILRCHLLPNLSPVVTARLVLSVASCIMTEATLSFIGLGDPTRATWGGMISLAYNRGGLLRGATGWFLAPGLCITAAALGCYLVSNHLAAGRRQISGDTVHKGEEG